MYYDRFLAIVQRSAEINRLEAERASLAPC